MSLRLVSKLIFGRLLVSFPRLMNGSKKAWLLVFCLFYGVSIAHAGEHQSLHKTVKQAGGDIKLKRVIQKGEMIVRYKSGKKRNQLMAASMRVGKSSAAPQAKSVDLIQLSEEQSVDDAVSEYSQREDVLYAEPNYIYFPSVIPDDSQFSSQWGLNKLSDDDINGPEAWDITTGSDTIVIGVIDTGVDYTHPDLVDNMWVNPGEIPGNGIDDDNNGWIDDIHGIDTFNDDGDPMDDDNHGTHVAGIIAAKSNNGLGIAGTSWNTKIIACKFMNPDGGNTLDAVRCLDYFRDLKARGVNIVATNNSWGGDWNSTTLRDAIAEQQDSNILFIASANNDGRDIDQVPSYPASYDLPNLVAVAAYDSNGRLAGFSNYGRKTVALGAPGASILSTLRGGSYGFFDGTSMAAPYVSGAVALLAAQDDTRDWRQLRNLVISSGKDSSDMSPVTQTGKGLRLADADGTGALTCTTGNVNRSLSPVGVTRLFAGEVLTIKVLAVECDAPFSSVQVSVDTTGELIDLVDDGTGGDDYANDGIFTAQWTVPDTHEAYDLTVAGEVYTVEKRIPQADLIAKMSGVTFGWYWNGKIQFNSKVENIGAVDAQSVVLTTDLPEGITFVSASSSEGNCEYVDAQRQVVCDFADVMAESTKSARISVVPDSTTAKYNFTTEVSTSISEFDETNNSITRKYGGAIKLLGLLLLAGFGIARRQARSY